MTPRSALVAQVVERLQREVDPAGCTQGSVNGAIEKSCRIL
jgi:hypothetical protein